MLQRGTCAQALVRTMVPWYPYGDAELVRGHRPSVVEFSHILREIPNEALSLSLSLFLSALSLSQTNVGVCPNSTVV